MPEMNFAHFHGAVPKYRNYGAVAEQGVLFITPEANATPRRYDPFEDSQGLLLDVVRAGAAVADCDAFMDYCLSKKILPLEDVAFWRCGDFFAPNPEKAGPLVDILLDFVYRYGLPAWEPGSSVMTTYPARYGNRAMAIRSDDDVDMTYVLHYELIQRACMRSKSGAMPVCTLALILLKFYLHFIEEVDVKYFPIRNTEWALNFDQQKTPKLTAQVYDLVTSINLAYAHLVSVQGKAVRQCKHCQTFFIAEDLRAEYCSPRCRGAYNSKMTRKRVKERKEREKAKI